MLRFTLFIKQFAQRLLQYTSKSLSSSLRQFQGFLKGLSYRKLSCSLPSVYQFRVTKTIRVLYPANQHIVVKRRAVSCSMSQESVIVKQEPEWEPESEAAARAGLCAGHEVTKELDTRHEATNELDIYHEVKIEVKLEPELIQPQDVVNSIQDPLYQKGLEDVKHELTQTGPGEKLIPMGRSEAGPPSDDTLRAPSLDRKPHLCKICHKAFEQESNFLSHVCVHSEDKTKLKRIPKTETRKTIYTCDSCNKDFIHKSVLIRHLKSHTKASYHCIICTKAFKTISNLNRHAIVHKDKTVYHCHICNKDYQRNHDLKRHLLFHTGEKPHVCQICNKQFSLKSTLASHILIHTEEKPFSCDICQKQFRHKSSLAEHRNFHTGEKPHSCQICKSQFVHKSNYRNHMRTHTGEKPYSCQTCDKRFSDSSSLRKHKLTHTGTKPFNCVTCQKQFTLKANLANHMKIHSGERPFSCETCNKQFRCKGDLKRHTLLHTGEKAHTCQTCKRQFLHKFNLTSHMRIHAKNPTTSSAPSDVGFQEIFLKQEYSE